MVARIKAATKIHTHRKKTTHKKPNSHVNPCWKTCFKREGTNSTQKNDEYKKSNDEN